MNKISFFLVLLIGSVLLCNYSSAGNNDGKRSKRYDDIRTRHSRSMKTTFQKNDNLKSVNAYKYKLDSAVTTYSEADQADTKYEYYYDENNFMYSEVEFIRSSDNGNWVKDYGYSYEMRGDTLFDYYYVWNNSTQDWDDDYLCINVYNAKGLIEEKWYYWWDNESKSFQYDYYGIISYSEAGGLVLWIEYMWSSEKSTWEAIAKWEYEYSSGQISAIRSYYIEDSGAFYIDHEEYFKYDSNSALIESTYWDWNDESNKLEKSSLYISSWDYDVTSNEVILPYYWKRQFYKYLIKDDTKYSWNTSASEWIKSNIERYYYSGVTTGNKTSELKNEIRVFPNPANDFVTIENLKKGSLVELFRADGKKLMIFNQNGSNSFFMGNIPSGLYVVKISNGDKVQVVKVSKK